MKRLFVLLMAVTLLVVIVPACGGGGGGGGDGEVPSSNWDEMVWDADDWA
jgi:hypothetical protein